MSPNNSSNFGYKFEEKLQTLLILGGGEISAYFMIPGRNINTMFSDWYEYY